MLDRNLRRRSYIPALGSRLHNRSGRLSHFKKSQRAMRRWGGNRHAIPASIFCTAPKTRGIGQAGSWSPRRIRCVVPADFSKASHYLTPTEVVTVAAPMSALGHKRTYATGMSALPPKADICSAPADVCFVPIADIGRLFDHVIGPSNE